MDVHQDVRLDKIQTCIGMYVGPGPSLEAVLLEIRRVIYELRASRSHQRGNIDRRGDQIARVQKKKKEQGKR